MATVRMHAIAAILLLWFGLSTSCNRKKVPVSVVRAAPGLEWSTFRLPQKCSFSPTKMVSSATAPKSSPLLRLTDVEGVCSGSTRFAGSTRPIRLTPCSHIVLCLAHPTGHEQCLCHPNPSVGLTCHRHAVMNVPCLYKQWDGIRTPFLTCIGDQRSYIFCID